MTDDMNFDDDSTGEADEFWGSTPNWSTSSREVKRTDKRTNSPKGGDITGAIRGLWSAAMTGGADATREHKIVDASLERDSRAADRASAIDPTMFDDLDHDLPQFDLAPSGAADFDAPIDAPLDAARSAGAAPWTDVDISATTELPRVDARHEPSASDEPDHSDPDDPFVAFAPTSLRTQSQRIDPLLARIGAVAVVVTLLVPLVIGMTSGDSDDDTLASGASPSSSIELVVDASTAETAASGTGDGANAVLDPATLPPAVPVNTDPPATNDASGSALASEAATASDGDETSATDDKTSTESSDDDSASSSAATSDDSVNESANADDGADRVTNCAIDFTVRPGDFWIGLADSAGVPLAELLEANGATSSTPLYAGTTICLPAGSTTPSAPPATTAPPETTTTTTTTTTSTTTTTTTPPPTDPDSVQQIIRDVWPDELEERALEIAFRESRYVPTAQNFCCYGIFQIYYSVHRSWLADLGITSAEQLFDPTDNARAAYTLYQRAGGWGPWQL